jgi:hypothetical protein
MAGALFADRVKDTSTTAGTGTYTLSGTAPSGYQSFNAGVGDGNSCYYVATDGTDWEVGVGTYTDAAKTLTRDSILQSSNGDAAVNWGAGSRTIFADLPADALFGLSAHVYQPAQSMRLPEYGEFHTGGNVLTLNSGVVITCPTGAVIDTTLQVDTPSLDAVPTTPGSSFTVPERSSMVFPDDLTLISGVVMTLARGATVALI